MPKKDDKTQQVLTFISTHRAAKGVSPSFAEIAAKLKFKSADTVTYYVKKLLTQGLLTRESGMSRGLVPSKREGIPIVNIIRVGRSELLPESARTYLKVDAAMFKKGQGDWLAIVPNHALLEADLLLGDLVVVQESKSFTPGHLICASKDEQIFIGFGHLHAGVSYIHLDPDDKDGKAIDVPDWKFWGIVIGVIRRSIRVKPDFGREQMEMKIVARVASRTRNSKYQ